MVFLWLDLLALLLWFDQLQISVDGAIGRLVVVRTGGVRSIGHRESVHGLRLSLEAASWRKRRSIVISALHVQ